MNDTVTALAAIDEAVQSLASNPSAVQATSTTEMIVRVRAEREALLSLPPRYLQVLDLLLDRFESSALFTEESCSFSRSDLLQGLQQWLAKAREAATATDQSR